MKELHRRFRANLASLLASHGWTQTDLAAELGVSPGYVSQLVSGHRNPGMSSLQSIANVFGIDPSELLKA